MRVYENIGSPHALTAGQNIGGVASLLRTVGVATLGYFVGRGAALTTDSTVTLLVGAAVLLVLFLVVRRFLL